MGAPFHFHKVSQLFPTRGQKPAHALHKVSLDIAAGEFVCLIGPSGCGKTTLLHMLAGFLSPTEGEVVFKGSKVERPGLERGVVFQEYALFPWMTARQNVEFGLRAQAVPAQERRHRALAALERVHLAHAAERYPHEMSGGMRQRVAVARSLVVEPEVLLMDEPFAAVDAMTRAVLQKDLLQLWQEAGVSVLFVTHNIDEAIFLAQRVVVMAPHPGTVRADLRIDLPYPRRRGSVAFAKTYNRIESALADGHERSAA